MRKSPTITLRDGREKSVRHRHPWLFSGALARVDREAAPGGIVRVVSSTGTFLAHAYYNPHSQIAARILSWDEGDVIDDAWWACAINQALNRRRDLVACSDTDSCRLVYAEADGLPGLIVDRYANALVCQFLTAGVETVRQLVIDHLWRELSPEVLIERSDDDMRKAEGLSPSSGVLRGTMPDPLILIRERGQRFWVDIGGGQKTGWYLDQRDSRNVVARYAYAHRVLDCFSYTGGFAVPVLISKPASLTCIDSSESALQILRRNLELLRTQSPHAELIDPEIHCANVFEMLRTFRDQGRQFDMVILDPPKLAASQAQLARAKRAYKDLNLLAMKLMSPGGILATFSCSGAVSRHDLQSVVGWAATDAGRRVQILTQLGQASDHPVIVSFPESEYLKGLLCVVD